MSNLTELLHHDVCDSLMDYVTLEIVMVLSMTSKQMPDLLKHHKIKNAFFNSALEFERTKSVRPRSIFGAQNFFDKFKHTDRLIKCIYDHQIIMRETFALDNIVGEKVIHYSECDYDIAKVFSAVIKGDLSYVYFCLFVNGWDQYIKLRTIADLFVRNRMGDKYKRFNDRVLIVMKKEIKMLDDKTSLIPWLTIGLIADNENIIKQILEMYHQCPYYHKMRDIGGTCWFSATSRLDTYKFLRNYIAMIYPELSELFELIAAKDRQMPL